MFTELPLLEPPLGYDIHYSLATAINNRGEIIGESNASMFVYRDGVLIDLLRDLRGFGKMLLGVGHGFLQAGPRCRRCASVSAIPSGDPIS